MKLSNDTITFSDDVIRDEAIETLVGHGMKGIGGQKDKPSLVLKFVDEKTAKDAHQILKSKLKESDIQRLQQLAGVRLNEQHKAVFFTDFGQSFDVTPEGGGESLHISRYAAWGDIGRGKPEVIETNDDINALKKKYGT